MSVTRKPSSKRIMGFVSKSSSESLAVISPLSTSILDLLSEVSFEVTSRGCAVDKPAAAVVVGRSV